MDHAVEFNQISIFNDISLGITAYPEQSQIADELIDQAFISLEKAATKKLQYCGSIRSRTAALKRVILDY